MSRSGSRWIALLAGTLLAAATVACGGGDGSTEDASATAGAAATQAPDAGTSAEAREIEVLMKDNFFEPTEIRLKVGEAVTIVAKNEGVAIHNMHILSSATEGTDFRSDPLVNPGEESAFDVQFSTAGTYAFQCDLHLPGMVGEIIVE